MGKKWSENTSEVRRYLKFGGFEQIFHFLCPHPFFCKLHSAVPWLMSVWIITIIVITAHCSSIDSWQEISKVNNNNCTSNQQFANKTNDFFLESEVYLVKSIVLPAKHLKFTLTWLATSVIESCLSLVFIYISPRSCRLGDSFMS